MLTEVKGLVIRSVDIKESDRLITIFTEQMGAITALARGARSLKSRHMSSTMQFCYSSFVLYTRGDKIYVREAELIESFFNIRNSIESVALASYVAEVLSDVTVSEPENELLRLALNSLYAISTGKYEIEKIKAAFEIRTAAILGFMPEVISCHSCGGRTGDFYFDIMGGFIECAECQRERAEAGIDTAPMHESRIISLLSEGAKTALCYCIYSPLEKLFSFNLGKEDMKLFVAATEKYFINQMERSYKTLDFYKEVKR
ncbi:MAG: DNA repair protein RecO [Clostridia bacterium]|nr:DNA repair protein RecO [Clostridia bacterium]